tara:strand:+ start:1053 stop:1343 length:291 start_codon:yes stop_codon:yes gene_type:complete
MYKETIVGKTKQGKEIAYRVKEGDALYSIYYKHGGQMPSVLTGMWSDPRQIVNAITTYLNRELLCPADQAIKDKKKNLSDSKRRPSRLKAKANAKS